LWFGGSPDSLGQLANSSVSEREISKMINILKNLHKEQSGQDLIEYALLALLIALAAVLVLPKVGSDVSAEFSKVAAQLT
jgi:pilus assembly protein Flp/PilA